MAATSLGSPRISPKDSCTVVLEVIPAVISAARNSAADFRAFCIAILNAACRALKYSGLVGGTAMDADSTTIKD